MKRLVFPGWFSSGCFCLFTSLSLSFAEDFRTIDAQVVGIDGKPLIGRKVRLVGLSRASTREKTETGFAKGWDFVTDGNGRISARLGDFGSWEDDQRRPGWGTYALVAERGPYDAGAVSRQFEFPRPGQKAGGDASEWGPIIAVPPEGLKMTLEVKEGITLRGKVWNANNPELPLTGVSIHTNNDLYSDTHSGHGGEILNRSTVAGSDGRFEITHIYPEKFYVGVGGSHGFLDMSKEAYWLKTKRSGKWIEEVLDEIVPSRGSKVVELEIMGLASPGFEFFGRVVDQQGKPIAEAEVTFALAYHPEPRTFEDWHSFQNTKTDGEGKYQAMLGTPWLRGMRIHADGYADLDIWRDDDEIPPKPGNFDVILKRADSTAK